MPTLPSACLQINKIFFHLKNGIDVHHNRVNSSRRKNCIQRLGRDERWVVNHEEKHQLIYDHFASMLENPPPRPLDFNWNIINPVIEDLDDLGHPFSEEEIKNTIEAMHPDKAPGPDGSTVNFFSSCLPIIKNDLMNVSDAFSLSRSSR